jgi:uncharacterized protein YecT (DUF1311 family)
MDGKDLIVLFGGGSKTRQSKDIEEAKKLNQEYKDRKAKLRAEEAKKGKLRAQQDAKLKDKVERGNSYGTHTRFQTNNCRTSQSRSRIRQSAFERSELAFS